MKHSKPTTKDISDIYDEYINLNNDINSILFKYTDSINIKDINNGNNNDQSKVISLNNLSSIITIYYNKDILSINNFNIDINQINIIFDNFNHNILNGYLKNLFKSNNLYDKSLKKNNIYDLNFITYNWRDLINNNQLILFLLIFNFFVDNPLNFIIDKIISDLVVFINNLFLNNDLKTIEPYFKYIIPSDVYDLSKKAEIITNSEHFMDKVSEILSIHHLLSGQNYLKNEDNINILSMLDIYFFNNKKMDYTRHINMKLFKNIIETIYINFNMRSKVTVATSESNNNVNNECLDNKRSTSSKKPGKKWFFINLINTLKNNNMSFREKNFIFDKVDYWFNSLYHNYPKNTSLRIPYCCIVIEQLIVLFSLANNVNLNYKNSKNYYLYGFNNILDSKCKYETFYQMKQYNLEESNSLLNLKILKHNQSNFKSFDTIEEQLIWIINQEIQSPLSIIQKSSNKFIFKLAYNIIHGDLLKFISGKSLHLSKFKEIYEFIDLSRFNGINTTFIEYNSVTDFFNVNKNHFFELSQTINHKMINSESNNSISNCSKKLPKRNKVIKNKKNSKTTKKPIETFKMITKSDSYSSNTLVMEDIDNLLMTNNIQTPTSKNTTVSPYYQDITAPKSLFQKKNIHNEPIEVFNHIEMILDS
ncbi:uncharacterized protein HGUI_01191 [Hanseniaspora guilliermondii]|uniref:Uncharacterized protein n=1 Tax=Hanseniaspora guilliermondii TaxID=56406 RepID=A0A1L0CW12_9ASCO|nr:uncharacterized protein HGUI_01191 [Hanseniaspora guilliermondii]